MVGDELVDSFVQHQQDLVRKPVTRNDQTFFVIGLDILVREYGLFIDDVFSPSDASDGSRYWENSKLSHFRQTLSQLGLVNFLQC